METLKVLFRWLVFFCSNFYQGRTLAYFSRNQYLGGFDYHTVEIYTITLDQSGLVAASGPSIKARGKAYGTGRKGSVEWKDGDLYWNQYGIYSDGDEPVFARVLKTGVIEPVTVSSGEYGDLRTSGDYVYKLGQAGTSLKIAATAGDTDDRPGYLPGQPWRASGTGPQLSYRRKGIRQYELTDHLGNVRAVIGDRLEEKTDENGQTAYAPELLSATDYFPFGMQMPGRVFVDGEGYRYGFNGMEKENAVNEDGYTTFYRQLDTWSGRWESVDPKVAQMPWQTSYCSMDNNPISFTDPLGDIINAEKLEGTVMYPIIQKITYSMIFESIGYRKIIGIANHSSIVFNLVPGGSFSGAVGHIERGSSNVTFEYPSFSSISGLTQAMVADEYTHMAQFDFYSKRGDFRNTLQDEVESRLIMAIEFSDSKDGFWGSDIIAADIYEAVGTSIIQQLKNGETLCNDNSIILNNALNNAADAFNSHTQYGPVVKGDVNSYKLSSDKYEMVKEIYKKE
jgi:RHS repeat-associated protein